MSNEEIRKVHGINLTLIPELYTYRGNSFVHWRFHINAGTLRDFMKLPRYNYIVSDSQFYETYELAEKEGLKLAYKDLKEKT